MKKCCIVLLLLLYAGFSLWAQSNSNVFIFFQSITGAGEHPDDNTTIVSMLSHDLSSRKYTLLNTPQGADYLLYGTITLFDEYANYEERYVDHIRPSITYTFNAHMANNLEQLYIFQLILRKVDTGDIVLQNVIYTSLYDVSNFFPVLANNLFVHITEWQPISEWSNKWLYAGLSVFWSPRVYFGSTESVNYANIGGGASLELHFLNFLSFETGLEIVPDWVRYSNTDDFRNLILEIPFLLKYVAKFTDYYLVGPYAGVQFNMPLYDTTKPAPFSWMVGILSGVKAGHGIFYTESRYTMDIGDSSFRFNETADPYKYRRSSLHIGLGYKYGFFTKK